MSEQVYLPELIAYLFDILVCFAPSDHALGFCDQLVTACLVHYPLLVVFG